MYLRTASTAAVLGGVLLFGAGAASASVCDAYSGGCTPPPSVPPSVAPSVTPSTSPSVLPRTVDRQPDGTDSSQASTLPFTGGELVLLTALGAGALAGGTALVVAGRRRKPDVA